MLHAGDKQCTGTNMYATSCTTRSDSRACQNTPLLHNCDSFGGQSGSPMYVSASPTSAQARGVLTCGLPDPNWNCGAWLRPQIEDVLKEWMRRGA